MQCGVRVAGTAATRRTAPFLPQVQGLPDVGVCGQKFSREHREDTVEESLYRSVFNVRSDGGERDVKNLRETPLPRLS